MSCSACHDPPTRRASDPSPLTEPTPHNPIRLSIAFHIPKEFKQDYDGAILDMWLRTHHVAAIYYELNRLFSPLSIRWTFNGCHVHYPLPPTDAQRDALTLLKAGVSDNDRKTAAFLLSEDAEYNVPASFNVHFIPYIDKAEVTSPTTIVVGVWSRDGQDARMLTSLLSERHGYVNGSISHTLAQTLCRALGIRANPADGGDNIMNAGYHFTQKQKRMLIIEARNRLSNF